MMNAKKHVDEHTMIGTKVSAVIAAFAMVLATLGSADAYSTRDCDRPTDLRIYLTLKTNPIHNNFTRYLTFINTTGSERSVAVSFTKSSSLTYEGHVTAAGLKILRTLPDHNNRSYWDNMYFENHGGSTSLDIKSFTAEIDYDSSCSSERESTAIIAYTLNKELDSGHDSFYLPAYSGRMVHALNYTGWSWSEYFALPSALRSFINDIGKSGSSGASDSASSTNPKYASGEEHALCSETVSWYYYGTGVEIQDTSTDEIYDFRDITGHIALHDQFQDSDRLYCFHSGREEWIRKNRSYDWVYGDTYEPQPGDYLNRRNQPGTSNGHSMMMVEWDSLLGVAHVIDGPWNINFRAVDVLGPETSGSQDFCVGRIPFNDPIPVPDLSFLGLGHSSAK
jgi:hypothetical protein